ncbi:MAG: ComF family protein [Candidatus Omnitrophota bacterium]|jgi:ComF family protein
MDNPLPKASNAKILFLDTLKSLINIIYPKLCLVCKRKLAPKAKSLVCGECGRKIRKNLPPFCHRCGRQLKAPYIAKNICVPCLKKKLHFDRAFSPCVYEGSLKELIHDFKYKNKQYLGATLSTFMIDFINEYHIPMDVIDLIVPVPLHKTKLREREFNQAQVLSTYIAKAFNKGILTDTLIRHRHTRTQAELLADQRSLNVKDSFSVREKDLIKGKHVLLVDDVLTTGSTASEAAFALKDAGAHIVFILTLAN